MPLTLKQLRVGKKLKQKEVADALKMNLTTYNAVENLDEELLMKIAKFYGVEIKDIKVVS